MNKFKWGSVLVLSLVIALGTALGAASSFAGRIRNEVRRYDWRSGTATNDSSESIVAAKRVIRFSSAVGLRVHFNKSVLGEGAFLRIRSNGEPAQDDEEGGIVRMDDEILRAYRYTTPYMGGNELLIELVVRPGGSTRGISTAAVEIQTMREEATRSQCGSNDDREPSNVSSIARMMKVANGPGGCTGTLISPTCMVSAGHCAAYLNVAQFNVPPSNRDGSPNYPAAKDQYPLNKLYGSRDSGGGMDWSVYSVKENPITRELPGVVQGFLKLSTEAPRAGDTLRITGYGDDDGDRRYSQQTNTGPVTRIEGTAIHHRVDTQPGNSGSTIVLESTGEVVGIHTHGGCSRTGEDSANVGTSLAASPEFQKAIKDCLGAERASLRGARR